MSVFSFFFKQKTAYEWRISDGSADVCSSDLVVEVVARIVDDAAALRADAVADPDIGARPLQHHPAEILGPHRGRHVAPHIRSEERRVGKECVSPCRSRARQVGKKNNSTCNTRETTSSQQQKKKQKRNT